MNEEAKGKFMSETGIDYWRQLGLVSMDELVKQKVTIIGCGGIGSFVAPALAKLGITKFELWDFDLVEPHNVPNQNFVPSDVGFYKVEIVGKKLVKDYKVEVIEHREKWDGDDLDGIVVVAVDTMEVRHQIWKKVKFNVGVKALIDGRIGGLTVNVHSLNPTDIDDIRAYEAHLYTDKQVEDLPCTERAIIDVAYLVTALIVRAVRAYVSEDETMRLTASMKYPQILEV